MELTQEEIESLISQVAGEGAIPVVRIILQKGENISEFLIADILEIRINHVRNILYRLQENNLVTFIRKKDKKKGWYIYYWTFNKVQAIVLIKKLKKERINTLRMSLKREGNEFFSCDKKCLRINVVNSLDYEFKCPECSGVLQQVDNKKKIVEIKKELKILTKPSPKIAT